MNTLEVEVAALPLYYEPIINRITAQHHYGMVRLNIGDKFIELSTTVAYDIGRVIMMADVAPDEMIVLVVNGERVELLLSIAERVAVALLRKADDADDWQINTRSKK